VNIFPLYGIQSSTDLFLALQHQENYLSSVTELLYYAAHKLHLRLLLGNMFTNFTEFKFWWFVGNWFRYVLMSVLICCELLRIHWIQILVNFMGYWSKQSFTCLGPENRCSSWGLALLGYLWFIFYIRNASVATHFFFTIYTYPWNSQGFVSNEYEAIHNISILTSIHI
jgi:hypothetical protein